MRRGIVLVLALVSSTREAHATCDERMTKLEERLRSLCPFTGPSRDPALKLAMRSTRGTRADGGGWVLEVDVRGKARLSGDSRSTDRLADQIASRLATGRREQLGWPIYVAAQPGTAVVAVHDAVAEARRAGLRGEARLLVEAPPPPAAPTDAELLRKPTVAAVNDEAGRDLDHRATVLGKALQRAIAPCAPILKIFGAMANEEPAEKSALFIGAVPAARECRCRMADVDVFEFAMLAVCGAFDPQIAWLPIPPRAGGKRTIGEALR